MGLVRSITRRVLDRVARRVAQDDLFEKPGERAPTAPLATPPAGPQPARGFGGKLGAVAEAADLDALQQRMAPGRVRVAHHWATWCEGCIDELPLVEELNRRLGASAQVVGVSWERFQDDGPLDESLARVREVANQAGLSFPSLVATSEPEALFEALELSFQQIPQTRVLDAQGQELIYLQGPMQRADVDRIVELIQAVA